jgi:hypothetical protein
MEVMVTLTRKMLMRMTTITGDRDNRVNNTVAGHPEWQKRFWWRITRKYG